MNQDTFIDQHRERWEQLNRILEKLQKGGLTALAPTELERLGGLYRQVTSDLAYARLHRYDLQLQEYLNDLAARSYSQIYVSPPRSIKSLWRFFARDFPEIYRHNRPYITTAALIFMGAALVMFLLAYARPESAEAILPRPVISWVEENFRTQQEQGSPLDLLKSPESSAITTNNIMVGIKAFSLGIFAGIGTVYILLMNGAMLGAIAAVFAWNHQTLLFWATVLPHGIIEIFSIFICGGAGLMLGHAILNPGPYYRREVLVKRGREAVQLIIGVIPLFMVAGAIEIFISFTAIHPAIKLLVAAGTLACLWFYLSGPRPRPKH